MTKLDGQVWLCLYNLLLKGDCQRKYNYNSFNKSQLLKVLLDLCTTNSSLLLCTCVNGRKRVCLIANDTDSISKGCFSYDASSYYTFVIPFLLH